MHFPEQLKNPEFRFIRVVKGRKNPIKEEEGWRERNGLELNNPIFQQHINQNLNYGVACGYGGLVGIDADNKIISEIFETNFGKTFRVLSGSGKGFHDYVIIKDFPKKIIFEKNEQHLGEAQFLGTYLVGPGSIHPSGRKYEIVNDVPIIEITYEQFKKAYDGYLKLKSKKVVRKHTPSNWSGDKVQDIPITNIISLVGLQNKGGGIYQGSHPSHGSTTGMNFLVDASSNQWVCYRCNNSGGGPAELIGVVEGIISCGEAGSNCFTKEQGQEIIKIAREKYGLTVPEKVYRAPMIKEPRGWARSVSIVRMAERNNLTKCPTCSTPLKFEDRCGLFYCSNCRKGGGLKQFAEVVCNEN